MLRSGHSLARMTIPSRRSNGLCAIQPGDWPSRTCPKCAPTWVRHSITTGRLKTVFPRTTCESAACRSSVTTPARALCARCTCWCVSRRALHLGLPSQWHHRAPGAPVAPQAGSTEQRDRWQPALRFCTDPRGRERHRQSCFRDRYLHEALRRIEVKLIEAVDHLRSQEGVLNDLRRQFDDMLVCASAARAIAVG